MSAVELAIRKVKQLSPNEAQQLLAWLSSRPFNVGIEKKHHRVKRSRSITDLKAWRKSIQLSTNWQPPRMPDDVVKIVAL